MGIDRFLGALDRFAYRVAGPTAEDRAAGLELAVASRRFSRRTKAVVDDKLSFSATLMRAGEVEAANRLLAEVEQDVRTEEAALIEVVNEVKFEREINRKPLTRIALARMMAAAMLGSTLLATSAVGMAVAGLFKEGGAQTRSSSDEIAARDNRDPFGNNFSLTASTREVRVGGVAMHMTDAELERFRELTQGGVDDERLENFLLGFLPPELAQQVQLALDAAYEVMPDDIEEVVVVLDQRVNEKRKEATEDPADETEEPSPSPSDGSEEEGSQDPNDEEDEEDDSGGLPIVGDDDGGEG